MLELKKILAFIFCIVLAVSAVAQEAGEGEPEEPQTYKEQYEKYQKQAKKTFEYPWFVGGAVGLAFGSETQLRPVSRIFGYRFSPLFQLGGSLTFRYRKDKKYTNVTSPSWAPAVSRSPFSSSIGFFYK